MALGASWLETRDFNWTAGVPLRRPFRAEVKIRYSARSRSAAVTPLDDGRRVRIEFDEQQRDITPGQAAVSYIDDEVVGGGIIQ
jgi:tRNA-specific 2-thiouridylase